MKFLRRGRRGSSIDKNPVETGSCRLGMVVENAFIEQVLDGSMGMGMDFVLRVNDHKRVSTTKEAQNNKVK